MKAIDYDLPKPTSQVEEVFYLLLKKGVLSRKEFMNISSVLNAPDCINILRNRGVSIDTTEVKSVNRFGRDVKHCYYSLKDDDETKAINQYVKMTRHKRY